jgi:hypothetical protein
MGSSLLTPSLQRLYQPDRPLQPPEHLHHPRSCRTRILDAAVPHQRILDSIPDQSTIVGMEREEV